MTSQEIIKSGAMTAGMVSGPYSKEGIVCQYPHMVSSNGVWFGDDPFDYTAPVFLAQITLFFFASRFIFTLLKPLRQSIITAQVLVSSSPLRWPGRRHTFINIKSFHDFLESIGL